MALQKRIAALLLLIICLSPLALLAQDKEDIEARKANLPPFKDDSHRFEVTVSYALQSVKTNLHHIPNAEEEKNTADLSRNQFEMTIGYYFTRYKTFGVELVGGFTLASGQVQEPAEVDDPDNPIIYPIEDLEHNAFNIGGNFVYNLGNMEFVPFVYAGGGVEIYDVPEDSSFPFTENYPYANIGLGLKYFHAEWIGGILRLEDRYHFMGDDVEGSQGELNQFRLSIGAMITF